MSRVVVITGASAGIGAEVARQLGARGDRLVLAARRGDALREVAASIDAETLPVEADVTRRGDVERLRDAALSRWQHVDVWINNAGRGIAVPVLQLTDEHVDEMIAVNVKSALYGMQAIVPHFRERNAGHLINVSSFLGRVPIATIRSAYNAAKAALNALTANLRMELAREGSKVHVSTVMPGVVDTEFGGNAVGSSRGARQPLGRQPGTGLMHQTVDVAAATIVDLIDHPRAEVYTNPAAADVARRYYDDVEAFERSLGTPQTS